MSEINMDVTALSRSAVNRVRAKQVGFVLLALFTNIINYLDRSTISIGALHIRADLGLTAVQLGMLLSVWSLSYAICNMPAGFLIDRFGARYIASGAIFIWSLAQMAGGVVTGFVPMLVSRLVLGVAESPTAPTNAKMVSTWIPSRRRGFATAVYTSATSMGPFLAPLVLTGLMLQFGWKMMFIGMGAAGVVFAGLYFFLYRDLNKAKLSDEERKLILGDDVPTPHVPVTFKRWASLFRFRTTWGLMVTAFCNGWVFWIFAGWLPLYLETEFHMSVAKTGIMAAIPFIGGLFGSLLGGFLSDWMERRGISKVRSRKIPIIVGTLGLSIFTVVVGVAAVPTVAIVFSFLAVCFVQMAGTAQWAAVTVLFPKNLVGSAITSSNFAAYLGATFSPIVTGLSVDLTGSFRSALLLGAAICLIGCVNMLFTVNKVVDEDAIEDALKKRSSE